MERGITNTPMQALVTLNDPQFAEAARVLSAVLLQDESASNDTLRIARGFERVVSRLPSDREIRAVQKLLESERQRYHENPGDAARSVSVGEWPAAAGIEPAEHAAWIAGGNAAVEPERDVNSKLNPNCQRIPRRCPRKPIHVSQLP